VNDVHELYLTQVWLRHHFKSNKSKHENRIPVLRAYVYRDGWVLGRPLFLLFESHHINLPHHLYSQKNKSEIVWLL